MLVAQVLSKLIGLSHKCCGSRYKAVEVIERARVLPSTLHVLPSMVLSPCQPLRRSGEVPVMRAKGPGDTYLGTLLRSDAQD